MEKRAKLAFTGIPTCYRSPHLSSFDELSSDIPVLGIPFDEGVGYRPGTRFGPRSIREYSMRFPYFDPSSEEFGYWDMEQKKRLLSRVTMADCGDVDVVPLDYEYVYRQIEGSIKTILKKGAFPVALGGDHSITYPIVRGFEGTGSLSLVQLDAHLDRRESVLDVRYMGTASSPMIETHLSPILAETLNLSPHASALDFTGSVNAVGTALSQCKMAIEAKRIKCGIVVGTENRQVGPGSDGEVSFGAAAVAMVVGTEGTIADIEGVESYRTLFLDRWRNVKDPWVSNLFDQRFWRDDGYAKHIGEATKALMAKIKKSAADYKLAILPQTDGRTPTVKGRWALSFSKRPPGQPQKNVL